MHLNSSNLSRAYLEKQIHSWLISINWKPQAILTENIHNNFFGHEFKIDGDFLH